MAKLSILPADVGVARHDTFHLRDGWLVKATRAVEKDGGSLSGPGAHHNLGVGKNMLSAIRHWALTTRLVVGSGGTSLALTDLGRQLLQADPFLEAAGTLWVIQHELASNPQRATFWYWMFNEMDVEEISEDVALRGFRDWLARKYPEHPSPSMQSIGKDWSCFVRTYLPGRRNEIWDEIQSPLVPLGLAERTLGAGLRLLVGRKTELSPQIFAWACARFLQADRSESAITSYDELRWLPRSPGRLFCLDTRSIVEFVERLVEMNWARVSGTAGLRTVHFSLPDPDAILGEYFSGRPALDG
jgi:hypothetical protein